MNDPLLQHIKDVCLRYGTLGTHLNLESLKVKQIDANDFEVEPVYTLSSGANGIVDPFNGVAPK